MYKSTIGLLFCLSSFWSYAQQDSLTRKVKAALADKFPSTRVLNIEYKQLAPYNTTMRLAGSQESQQYKIKQLEQFRFDGNFELLKRRQWVLSTSLHYQLTSFNGSAAVQKPFVINSFSGDFHYQSIGMNLTHFKRLFNKPAVFNATISVDGSEQHFERVKGALSGILVVKHTAETTISLGVIAILEPSVQVPVLPVFSYVRRFQNDWELDMTLPQRIYLKKQFLEHSRLSLGSQLNKTSFYIYDNPAHTYEFRQLEINSGVVYERIFGGAFIGTLKAGIQNVFDSRIFEKEKSFKNYTIDNTPKPSFYINAGVSFNPFYKK